MSFLPLFNYPTIITLVDDDPVILHALMELLKKEYALVAFDQPQRAILHLENQYSLYSSVKFLRGCHEFESYNLAGHLPVDLNYDAFLKVRSMNTKPKEVSVMVVDYYMTQMTGMDVCRYLKSYPMKKILLTGAADERIATMAFNEGIIDCFIRKDYPNVTEKLRFQLNRLSQQYLLEKTQHLQAHLETDRLLPISDATFADFFTTFCDKHRIREYYAIDHNANFLLIDSYGKRFIFVIHTNRTLNEFVELHSDTEHHREWINAVSARQKIPFFGERKEGWEVQRSDWPRCFYTPSVFEGRETYYWTVIEINE